MGIKRMLDGLRNLLKMQVVRYWAVLTVVALLLRLEVQKQWPTLLETGVYLVFLLLVAAQRPLGELFGGLSQGQQRFLLGFIGLMLVTQVWSQPFKTFPFTPWNMYAGSAEGQPEYFEYTGIRAGGDEVLLPVHRLFRSQKRFVTWKLNRLSRAMDAGRDEEQRERARRDYTALLRAVARRYDDLNEGAPVERIRVTRCTMSRPRPGRPLTVARQRAGDYDVR